MKSIEGLDPKRWEVDIHLFVEPFVQFGKGVGPCASERYCREVDLLKILVVHATFPGRGYVFQNELWIYFYKFAVGYSISVLDRKCLVVYMLLLVGSRI